MVVDLTVHGENISVELINQRLCAVLHVYNAEPLVRNNGPLVAVNAAPVGATVADLLGQSQGLVTQVREIGKSRVELEDSENAAHSGGLHFLCARGSDGPCH